MSAGVVLKHRDDPRPHAKLVVTQVATNIIVVRELAVHKTEVELDVDGRRALLFGALDLVFDLSLYRRGSTQPHIGGI